MDIPASPPLSPSDISSVERLASLTSKFDKFLELKRTKGQHFNSRIAQSAATKNPGLMDKLMRFVGVETEFWFDDDDNIAQNDISLDKGAEVAAPAPPAGAEQYATTLSKEVWDPSAMPGWAYRDRLRKTQERMQRESERKRGERVEFDGERDAFGECGLSWGDERRDGDGDGDAECWRWCWRWYDGWGEEEVEV
ncbi:hypothetical protein N0V85_008384 [Neurospora sp. IMI 360204]|nr:hypothetical protein N0V85_008384 [Neurospora sp. IMI 360204]